MSVQRGESQLQKESYRLKRETSSAGGLADNEKKKDLAKAQCSLLQVQQGIVGVSNCTLILGILCGIFQCGPIVVCFLEIKGLS